MTIGDIHALKLDGLKDDIPILFEENGTLFNIGSVEVKVRDGVVILHQRKESDSEYGERQGLLFHN